MKQKEFVVSIIFFVLLVFLYAIFPIKDNFQNILTAITFLVILPVLYIKFILRKKIELFGVKLGIYKNGLIYSTLSVPPTLLILYVFIKYTSFLNYYTLPTSVINNFSAFLLYELIFVLLFVGVYEFFFRGFVFFTCEEKIGRWAIIAQMGVFYLLIAIIGTSKWNFLPYIVFAPFAGLIIYKSRSLIYSIITQLLIIILLDSYLIYLVK